MEIRYIKSAAGVLDRNCVNKRGLDLSKEVLHTAPRGGQKYFFKIGFFFKTGFFLGPAANF